MLRERAPLWLKLLALAGGLCLYVPILTLMVHAFTKGTVGGQGIGLTFEWFAQAWQRPDVLAAFWVSLKVACIATLIALALGTLSAAAVARRRRWERNRVSWLIIIPILLPGFIVGVALKSVFEIAAMPLGYWAIIIAHATICVAIVYSNAALSFRKDAALQGEASMDLGANSFQTFNHVIMPTIAPALLSGALLAFAVSFNEVLITYFIAGQETTLPLWLLNTFTQADQTHVASAVATIIFLVTLLPVATACHLLFQSKR